MKKIVVIVILALILVLSACGKTEDNTVTSGDNNLTTENSNATSNETSTTNNNQGFQILEQPEAKLPTILLYDKDGVKLTLSEPDPELLKQAEMKKEKTFERAGMLTLENNKDITVGIGFAELYINRILTDENILELSAEAGKTEKLILNLTPYKNRLWYEEESLLENGEIYSITFQTSIVDINAGWVPFDRFDYYIPIKDEDKQQAFLDKFTSKENLCFENEDLAIYFMERYYIADRDRESQRIQKYYEFIIKNKTDQYLSFGDDDETPSIVGNKSVKNMKWPFGIISPKNYMIDYLILDKIDNNGDPILQYDEIKQSYLYGLSEMPDSEDLKSGEFEFIFKPGNFELETTSTEEEVYYKEYR